MPLACVVGRVFKPGMLLFILLAWATPAHAQIDFSGVWQPVYQEDVPERLAGPALRDYVGLPINDNARQFADTWDPAFER
jgi:hypothetical protein